MKIFLPATAAMLQQTLTIPIIFVLVADPVGSGFVASLPRPGGNVTGMSLTAGTALSEKWLEILKETFPNVTSVAVLAAASNTYVDRVKSAANSLGVELQYLTAGDTDGIDRALRAGQRHRFICILRLPFSFMDRDREKEPE